MASPKNGAHFTQHPLSSYMCALVVRRVSQTAGTAAEMFSNTPRGGIRSRRVAHDFRRCVDGCRPERHPESHTPRAHGNGPRIAPGPAAGSLSARPARGQLMRVCVLSAPYSKMPIEASVGSPASSKVMLPE